MSLNTLISPLSSLQGDAPCDPLQPHRVEVVEQGRPLHPRPLLRAGDVTRVACDFGVLEQEVESILPFETRLVKVRLGSILEDYLLKN